MCIEQSAGHGSPAAKKLDTPEKVVCIKRQSSNRLLLRYNNRLVAAKLEIGDPAIALSDVTDRTSFRKLDCLVATLWGRHYSSN